MGGVSRRGSDRDTETSDSLTIYCEMVTSFTLRWDIHPRSSLAGRFSH